MLSCALKPQREVFVGNMGRMMGTFHAIFPAVAEPIMAQQIDKGHFKQESAPPTSGNVFEPMQPGKNITDDWQEAEKTSIGRRIPILAGSLIPLLLLGSWFWVRHQNAR